MRAYSLSSALGLGLAFCISACDSAGPISSTDGTLDAASAKPDKALICHVGSEVLAEGPYAGMTYKEAVIDGDCDPLAEICPDAGKIDLIEVNGPSKHLGNPSHMWEGQRDYKPGDVGASGVGDEDTTDGDGIDDGCEIPVVTACFIDATWGGSFNLEVNPVTGTFTSSDPCPWFGGACSVSGTATPGAFSELGQITGLTYIETNTNPDPGCLDNEDAFVSTLSRIGDTDEFSGTYVAFCDGEVILGPLTFELAFLYEGPCSELSASPQLSGAFREKGRSTTQ